MSNVVDISTHKQYRQVIDMTEGDIQAQVKRAIDMVHAGETVPLSMVEHAKMVRACEIVMQHFLDEMQSNEQSARNDFEYFNKSADIHRSFEAINFVWLSLVNDIVLPEEPATH